MKLAFVALLVAVVMFGQSLKTRQDGWLCNKDATGAVSLDSCKPNMVEALDVPAVHHDSIPVDDSRDCPSDAMVGSNATQTKYLCQPAKEWTCADEERILERAESGKHWCRKVQP